jgi:AGZA family xanthine/uracil permease-like MFS transporter
VSILVGNLFYAWQARRLALRTGRDDVTALPYGLNTPSLLVYIYFVMAPVYQKTNSAELAWKMGLLACLGSGVIEFLGAFVAGWIRNRTPRAALLSTLAGISIGFISMQFALEIFQKPLVAMLPLAIILITLFARAPFPLGMPGGLVAVLLGTACAWLLPAEWTQVPMSAANVQAAAQQAGWYPPIFVGRDLLDLLKEPQEWIGYLSVIIPMGLFNVIGSLQNIESAEASGDRFHTGTSLAANGIGTLAAAFFGSCFPTTIYIGHPGWKGLGARAGYSVLNGAIITAICLTGTVKLLSEIVPTQAGIAIVLWVGVMITAQAFQATKLEHAPAVAVGLFPAIAAWGLTAVQGAFFAAGPEAITIQQALTGNPGAMVNGYSLHGMIVVERGSIFTCTILAAISALLLDRKLYSAGLWSLLAAGFAAVGLTHAYQLRGNVVDFLLYGLSKPESLQGALIYNATPIAVGYLLFAVAFFAFGAYLQANPHAKSEGH